MKVATLTLPLHVNYGAVLQAFALQKALTGLGYNSFLLDIRPSIYKENVFISLLSHIKTSFNKFKNDECEYGNLDFEKFINKHINKTEKIRYSWQLKSKSHFDAYIVGSDQVWRKEYALRIEMFYFDFVRSGKTLSYAASFGKSDWTYTPKQTENCSRLLSKFDAVSVREESGKSIVSSKMGCTATHVLDPTMIISEQHYHDLIEESSDKIFSKQDIFCYVLDKNSEKEQLINSLCKEKEMNRVFCNEGLEDKNKISIENWLQGIRDSGIVVTDSFHGMVFCILFKKDFIIMANTQRGYERFKSLLSELKITDRLINEKNLREFDYGKLEDINYDEVTTLLNKRRIDSIDFLKNSLSY